LPIKCLDIRNFKLIDEASIEFSRVNLLIGPNASGKSTVLHAINAIKTSVSLLRPTTPGGERRLSLGNWVSYRYEDLVYLHDPSRWITLKMEGTVTLIQGADLSYELEVKMSSDRCGRSCLKLSVDGNDLYNFVDEDLKKPKGTCSTVGVDLHNFRVMIADGWDDDPTIELRMREGDTLLYRSSFEDLLNEYIHFCPVLRGDVKYEVSFSGPLEKILNVVAKRPELKDKWNEFLSEVLDFNCKVDTSYTRSGALQLLNITTRSNVALEPFSLAQLLYVVPLVLAARPSSTILIEEPEIHLHPRAQAKLVERLAKISEEYNLQLILTTHSEHVLFRLLTLVREGTLKPKELKIYYFEREKTMPPKISIEELKVNEKGELDKGLKGFFEANLNELSRFVRAKSGG